MTGPAVDPSAMNGGGDPDPLLLKVAREISLAQQKARAQNKTLPRESLEAYAREETGGKYGYGDAIKHISGIDTDPTLGNVGRGFASGASFNWGNKIWGALNGPGAQDDWDLRQQLYHNAHPALDNAANVAGGLTSGLLIPGAAEAGLGNAVARGALTGAAAGALSGAGAADDGDRLGGAAMGAASGGLLGAAVPGAIGAVRGLMPASAAAARVSHAIEQSGGANALRGTAAEMAASGRGDQTMLADLSDHLRSQADFAANVSDDVRNPLAKIVRGRQADASDRLVQDARTALGGDPQAEPRIAQLAKETSDWAKSPAGYTGLRAQNGPSFDQGTFFKTFLPIVQESRAAKMLNEAKNTGLIGSIPNRASPANYENIQDFKESLDDAVAAAYRGGKGNLGSRLGDVRDQVVDFLGKNVPGWADVNAKYAARKGLERAVQGGVDAWNETDSRGLAAKVAGMEPDALNEFRHGMASSLISKLRSVSTNQDQAKQLLDASPAMEDKLRTVFGDQQTFDSFMQRVQAERELAKQSGSIGGSATARRQAGADVSGAELGMAAATNGMSGVLGTGKHLLTKMAKNAATRAAANQMGPLLMTQGQPEIDQLLANWGKRGLNPSEFTTHLPAAAGNAGHGLFGLLQR